MPRPRAGYVGFNATPATAAYSSAAVGIWTVREAQEFVKAGTWPIAPLVPGQPTSLSAVANGSGTLALTWTAPSSNGGAAITNYSVQYTPSGGATVTVLTGGTSTSYSLTGLTNGTAYAISVAAVNPVGTGAYSTSATATPRSFTSLAVLLTSGTSYTVPNGATTMKAWAVGGGSFAMGVPAGGAGGVAFKTWSVSGGQAVLYAVGSAGQTGTVFSAGGNTTVTFSGTTITGNGATSGTPGSFSGGDGGASGGADADADAGRNRWGGAVGGNNGAVQAGKRRRATDVSGLFAAVAAAGGKTVEDDGATPAFGSGAYADKYFTGLAAGLGGGGRRGQGGTPGVGAAGGGAVVLYFT